MERQTGGEKEFVLGERVASKRKKKGKENRNVDSTSNNEGQGKNVANWDCTGLRDLVSHNKDGISEISSFTAVCAD